MSFRSIRADMFCGIYMNLDTVMLTLHQKSCCCCCHSRVHWALYPSRKNILFSNQHLCITVVNKCPLSYPKTGNLLTSRLSCICYNIIFSGFHHMCGYEKRKRTIVFKLLLNNMYNLYKNSISCKKCYIS